MALRFAYTTELKATVTKELHCVCLGKRMKRGKASSNPGKTSGPASGSGWRTSARGVHGLPSPVTPSGALTSWNCPASLKSPSQRGQPHSPPMLFQDKISGTSGKCPARQGGAGGPGLDSPQRSPDPCTGAGWQKPQVEPTGQHEGETHLRTQACFLWASLGCKRLGQ